MANIDRLVELHRYLERHPWSARTFHGTLDILRDIPRASDPGLYRKEIEALNLGAYNINIEPNFRWLEFSVKSDDPKRDLEILATMDNHQGEVQDEAYVSLRRFNQLRKWEQRHR